MMNSSVNPTMQAAVYTRYGAPDVLHLAQVATPVPKDDEILVRVRAASVGYGDLAARRFSQLSPREFNMPALMWLMARLSFGWTSPRQPILGAEFAGDVAAVGSAVTQYQPGDAVFGFRSMALGAYAEYVTIKAAGLVAHKPDTVSYAEAAAIPGGALTALNLLRAVGIQPGERVLIVGASGSIGAAAVQLAKAAGAHVTGVCGTPRLAYVRALGADAVIDYSREDFTEGSAQYDVIVDVLGKGAFERSRRVLRAGGRYLYASFKLPQLAQMVWTRGKDKRVICALSSETADDMQQVRALVEAGTLRAVIDRCYGLDEAAEAHRYVEGGEKTASVVITVAPA